MKKCLVSDVDGTLIQLGSIDAETLTKVKNFVNEGNVLILASGRVYADILEVEKALGVVADYRVSQNGMVIYDHQGNLLYNDKIPYDSLVSVLEYVFSIEGINIEINAADYRYANVARTVDFLHSSIDETSYIIVDDLKQKALEIDVTTIVLMSHDDDLLSQLEEYINNNYQGSLQIVETYKGFMEVLSVNSSKGRAIDYLLPVIGLDKDQVYVVGDNYNDVSMFEHYYSNSYVIANANQEVISKGKYVVKSVGDLIDYINTNNLS